MNHQTWRYQMKKELSRFVRFIITITLILCFSTMAWARVEWQELNNVPLEDKPIDMVVSKDGQTTYILSEKKILLYSAQKRQITDTIPLTGNFNQITLLPNGETLVLADTDGKQLTFIKVSQIYDIAIGDSPIIGKADAPVNIFAFSITNDRTAQRFILHLSSCSRNTQMTSILSLNIFH